MASFTRYQAAVKAQREAVLVMARETAAPDSLVKLATLAASSHNSQPWTFSIGPNRITIQPDFARRCPAADPDDAHLFKSLGCAAENIVHGATLQGRRADVTFDPDKRRLDIAFEPANTVRESPLAAAIPKRQNTWLLFDGRAIDRADRAALEGAGRNSPIHIMLIDDVRRRDAIAAWVAEGDRILLADPAFRKELISWFRFSDTAAIRTGDGLAIRTGGRKPLPEWLGRPLMRVVLTGKAQARADIAALRSSSVVAVFTAPGDDAASWVEAGRVYQRFALQATLLGIRSAFINQPIDVGALRPQLHDLLALDNETALLMLRLGHGPEAPFSLRRPLDDVLIPAEQ